MNGDGNERLERGDKSMSMRNSRGKIIYVLLDGVGDLPHPSLNYLTPLESAYTPNLDALARDGRMGMVYTVGKGIAPESDIAVFSMLGYRFNDDDYPGRGIVEAIGAGMDVRDGDLAMRGNFATMDDGGVIVDRRVGRNLMDEEAKELVKAINDEVRLDGAEYELVHTKGHRIVLRVRAKSSLSADISNTDPAYERVKGIGVAKEEHGGGKMSINRCKALSRSRSALLSARLVNEFTEQAIRVLRDHPVNVRRRGMLMLEANCILLRDAGSTLPRVEPIASRYNARFACIVDMPVEYGIARVTGMDILDGGSMRDYEIKAKRAIEALSIYDVVYVHLKGPDEFGHDGNARGKEESIEEIDERFFGELLRLGSSSNSNAMDEQLFIAVSGDHSTPCIKKAHSADPVPLLVSNPNMKDDGLCRFTEREARKGSIGYIMGHEVLGKVFNIISSSHNP